MSTRGLDSRTAPRMLSDAIEDEVRMPIRAADEADLEALATLWHDGWHDAHAALVPAELVRRRTLDNFHSRMTAMLPTVRTLGPVGAPLGFHFIKGDELNQFYVTAAARGQGVAARLMADGEARLAELGVHRPWLACVVGNERAARFYEKSGWRSAGVVTEPVETSEGSFDVEVWRYEKALTAPL
jgi:GNAT superfamily N-acetyltransferase